MSALRAAALTCVLLAGCPSRQADPPPTPRTEPTPQKVAPPKAPPPAPKAKPQCTGPRQCALWSGGCCGACWSTPLARLKVGINAQYQQDVARCAKTKHDCEDCKLASGTHPNYVAVCQQGKCIPLDLATSSFTVCAKDDDCRLATTGCCTCWDDPVALAKERSKEFKLLFCGKIHCRACMRPAFVGVKAVCRKGHCVAQGRWKRKAERRKGLKPGPR